MKKTKVICSIGPASDSVEVMGEMVNNGMDCARINLSHATPEGILKTIEVIRQVRKEYKRPLAIMYDTKGPEFRTLTFKDGGVTLKKGDTIRMSASCILGDENEFGVNHSNAINFIEVGDRVLIDNALFELEVIEKKEDYVVLKALGNGKIQDHKTINVPGVDLNLEFMSEVDKNDIAFAAKHACDYLALSFVNSREDVMAARKIIEKAGGDALIISKIESRKGIENIDEIIDESDGIMVARGDLGVEVPLEELPILQKNIITKCRQKGKFAIVATEMLASMYESPRPTRAEVSDVANAIMDGTDCVMLSGETAAGNFPVESVAAMAKIVMRAENNVNYIQYIDSFAIKNSSEALSHSAATLAKDLNASAIVVCTRTGATARMVSRFRPNINIIGITTDLHAYRKLALSWGVLPALAEEYTSVDILFYFAKKTAIKSGLVKKGDTIVITGGTPNGKSGNSNLINIETI